MKELEDVKTTLLKQLYYNPWTWKQIDDFFKEKFSKSSSSYHINKLKDTGLIIEINGHYELTEKGKATIKDEMSENPIREIDFIENILDFIIEKIFNEKQKKIQNKKIRYLKICRSIIKKGKEIYFQPYSQDIELKKRRAYLIAKSKLNIELRIGDNEMVIREILQKISSFEDKKKK